MTELACAMLIATLTAAAPADPPHAALVPVTPELAWGPNMGVEPGVRTVDSVTPLLFSFESAIPSLRGAGGVAARFAELVLLDFPVADESQIFVHEVFGHGARARELGQSPTYAFHVPAPYRWLFEPGTTLGGETSFTRTGRFDADLSVTEAGIEAESFSAWWVERAAVRRGFASHAERLMYLTAKLPYASRLWPLASDLGNQGGGSDADEYVRELDARFNRAGLDSRRQTARRIQLAYLWNFVDPLLWDALYEELVGFLANGRRTSILPRLGLGDGQWLFVGTRFALTPFGAEHTLDVFLAPVAGGMADLQARVVSTGLARAWGLGGRLDAPIGPEGLEVMLELHGWQQPSMLPELRNAFDAPERFGGSVAVGASWRSRSGWGLFGQVRAKSGGYLMGAPIDGGVSGYLGASFTLPAPG